MEKLNSQTVAQLKETASKVGLRGYSKMRKEELKTAIASHLGAMVSKINTEAQKHRKKTVLGLDLNDTIKVGGVGSFRGQQFERDPFITSRIEDIFNPYVITLPLAEAIRFGMPHLYQKGEYGWDKIESIIRLYGDKEVKVAVVPIKVDLPQRYSGKPDLYFMRVIRSNLDSVVPAFKSTVEPFGVRDFNKSKLTTRMYNSMNLTDSEAKKNADEFVGKVGAEYNIAVRHSKNYRDDPITILKKNLVK